MRRLTSHRRASLPVALTALALLLSGCGQKVIIPAPTERVVSNFVLQRTGAHAKEVHCPSGVPAKAGGKFQCHFTGPDGKYTAYMTILSVRGSRVEYDIETHRNGQTLPPARTAAIVSNFVFMHSRYRPPDMTCPAGVPPLVGRTFQCHFTGPDGKYTADVRVTGVLGTHVDFQIVTRRTG